MIDEFDDFTTVTLRPIDVNTSPAARAGTADAARSNLPLQVKMRESTYSRQHLMRYLRRA